MRSMLKQSLQLLIVTVLIAVGMLAAAETSFAEGKANENVPLPTQETSTFTLDYNYVDGEESTPIKGAEFTAHRIADLSVKGGSVEYKLTGDFSALDVDFNGLSATDSYKVAEAASEIVKDKGLTGKSAVTGANGKASFGSLKNGIYLVEQTGANGAAKDYKKLTPWLVQLPELLGEEGNYSWNYEVDAMPKPFAGKYQKDTPKQKKEPKEKEKITGGDEEETEDKETDNPINRLVKTGDEMNIFIYIGVLVITLGLLLVIWLRNRKRKNR